MAAIALIVSCAVGLFFGALFRDEQFARRDLANYHWPARHVVARLLQQSHGVADWNPYWGSGQPLASNPEHALFHPLTAAYRVMSVSAAFRLQAIVPILFGLAAMYFFLRAIGRSTVSSSIAASSWGFGGYMLSNIEYPPILLTVFAVPLVLGLVWRLAHGGERFDGRLLALSFGLVCIGVEPSTLLMMPLLVVAVLWSADRSADSATGAVLDATWGDGMRRLIRVAVPLAVGVLIGGAALLPAWQLSHRTLRATSGGGVSFESASHWSFPPTRMVELVLPRAMGHFARDLDEPGWYWAAPLYPHRHWPYLPSIYPGLLVTVLAVAAAATRPRRNLPWIVTAVVGGLFACGAHTPIWSHLRELVPLMASLRFPEKYLLLTTLCLAPMAAHALDGVLAADAAMRRAVRALLVVIAALVAVALGGVLAFGSTDAWRAVGLPPNIVDRFGAVVAKDLATTLALAIGFLVILSSRALDRRPQLARLCLLALVLVDLLLNGRALTATTPTAQLDRLPAPLRALAADRDPGPIFHAGEHDRRRAYVEVRGEPPIPSRWGIRSVYNVDYDLTELSWSHQATESFLEVAARRGELIGPLLARRGAVGMVRIKPAFGPGRPGPRVAADDAYELVRIRDPRPFAYCAGRVSTTSSPSDWIEQVLSLDAAVADAVLIDSRVPGEIPTSISPCHVVQLASMPDRHAFEVSARGPRASLVAFNQTWDRNWRARVDGVDVALLRADLSLMAIVVPPGEREIVLEYVDPWLRAGVVLSLLGVAIVVFTACTVSRADVEISY